MNGVHPSLPISIKDLEPLPACDGPKLQPFDFRGSQQIEFLERVGDGLHAIVFKIRIADQIYALKVFRFVTTNDWYGHPYDDSEAYRNFDPRPLSHYSEPFNAECRAFGRLRDTGHEELAIKCFGYVLLDDEHERALKARFPDTDPRYGDVNFNCNGDIPGHVDLRSLLRTPDGRLPPLRAIVKEFGTETERLRPGLARKILRNLVCLQQLGILRSDIALRQLINGKIADFSFAITMPHFMSTAELNPQLNAAEVAMMERELFKFSLSDFWDFDNMVLDWNNDDCEDPKDHVSVWAYPHKHLRHNYNLRSSRDHSQSKVWTYVDTRLCDWRITGNAATPSRHGRPTVHRRAKHRRLESKPERWYCDSELSQVLDKRWRPMMNTPPTIDYLGCEWVVKDGLVFPREC